jgi:regulator of sirC expression with transglutaminase-like and TPR domain
MGLDVTTEILIDPYNRGVILTEAECRKRIQDTFQGQLTFRPEFLDFHRALKTQQLLLAIHPDRPTEIRDRGLIYYRLACLGQAARDLDTYLKAVPSAPDADELRRRLKELARLAPRMN